MGEAEHTPLTSSELRERRDRMVAVLDGPLPSERARERANNICQALALAVEEPLKIILEMLRTRELSAADRTTLAEKVLDAWHEDAPKLRRERVRSHSDTVPVMAEVERPNKTTRGRG